LILYEKKMNLLTVPAEYIIVHCISGDYALGAGVAKQINEKFATRAELIMNWSHVNFEERGPFCAPCGRVYNLVTKAKYWQKPTLDSLRLALQDLRSLVKFYNIQNIAMPKIGCGLDKLKWTDVKPLVREVFADLNVTIRVCVL